MAKPSIKIVRNNTSGTIQLSANFYLSEFIDSDTAVRLSIDNKPDPLVIKNLFRMAELMEQVRKLLGGRALFVSSGYRSPALNQAIGGAASSDHLRGEACDFVCRGFGTPLQVAQAIAKSDLKFGQLIQEGSWVHLSLPGGAHEQQVLTAHFAGGHASYSIGLS